MKETLDWLHGRIGLNFAVVPDEVKMAKVFRAAELLGNPQKSYPSIHVTGTNGKGSTIAFMRELFLAHDKRVGTFTSPHMVSIHDRICVDSKPISDSDFVRLATQVRQMEEVLVADYEPLSFFEILTLMGLLYFKEQAVDVCLLEVGIGGLLDTTNIVTGEIALVTSVGLDHQETLGSTLEEIARQKAGIFKPGQQAVLGPLPAVAKGICQAEARNLGTELFCYGEDFSWSDGQFESQGFKVEGLILSLRGEFQTENAALALQAFKLFMDKRDFPVDKSKIQMALAQTAWPGRLELVAERIYLDGAHNLPALERLVDFIKCQKNRNIYLLFGALKRKDYQEMLSYVEQELSTAQLFVTSFSYDGALEQKDIGHQRFVDNFVDFVDNFVNRSSSDQLLFITGSLYFISEVRAYLLSKSVDKEA